VDCESRLQTDLASPSSYHRVSVDKYRDMAGAMQVETVTVDYDASNAYGATMRGKAICKYIVKDGEPVIEARLSFENG
jgi:hypothetical protein